MDHFKKDMIAVGIFLLILFIGWVLTGGPGRARQTGSDHDKFQKPLAPISSGETYDESFKNISPIKVKTQNQTQTQTQGEGTIY